MAYQVTKIPLQEAEDSIGSFEWALLYMLSEVVLKRTADLGTVDWSQCTEARLFSGDREIHIFEDPDNEDGGMTAVLTKDNGEDKDHERLHRYELANRFLAAGGRHLVVKQYLAPDEDGQCTVVHTRLCGIG